MSTASDLSAVHGRDPRLDFYRGLGMLIILIAHIPINGWVLWIPARFGFSDATEIFVFCSGMASAIAFGRVFDRAGWLLGTARITLRVWQVYWSHIGIFVLLLTVMVGLDAVFGGERYVRSLYLHPFFAEPKAALLGLLTLRYVPNYFDILPMYLVVLALVPVVMALARFGPAAVVAWVLGLWAVAGFGLLDLPAEPWSTRIWFFNPFSWQLIFFTGFAFARSWLAPPPVTRGLIAAAIAILLVAVPFAWHPAFELVPALGQANAALALLIDKTHLGALRVAHFLALAYLAYAVAGERGRWLTGAWVDVVQLVGRQSLAVFLASLVLAQLLGVFLDLAGRQASTFAVANLTGFAVLVAVARIIEWYKGEPWRKTSAAVPSERALRPGRWQRSAVRTLARVT
jgi:hypothetical protein